MSDYELDLFVVGAGSGGVRAARMSAGLGARVGICEDRRLGGTCVNVGCVPKKLFVYASGFAQEAVDAGGFGWSFPPGSFDWPTLVANKDREIERLNGVYRRLLVDAGVEILEGRGMLVDPHTVRVGDRTIRAERILIATGSRPRAFEVPGGDHAIPSDALFALERLPERVTIVGAGYIGLEFASIFNGLGVEVHLIHRGDRILRGFDEDVRTHLARELAKRGIHLHLGHAAREVRVEDGVYCVELRTGERVESDLLVRAIGRVPNTEGLGLAEAGVMCSDNGAILVDPHFRSSAPSVYAIGDVIDRMQLTPVALAEGTALARGLFGGDPRPLDYRYVPTAVFTQPAVGAVGMTEAEAHEHLGAVDVYQSTFTPMKMTLAGRDEKSLMKLVVERDTGRVVGCHVVGPEAGEIVQGFAVALRMGATKADLDATIGVHPTAAEELVTLRQPRS